MQLVGYDLSYLLENNVVRLLSSYNYLITYLATINFLFLNQSPGYETG